MSNIMKASIDTLAKGLDSLKNIKKDKQEYKEYMDRIKALPDDYAFVYGKITEYMWSYSGGGDGYDMLKIHYELIELFESGAANGKQVLEITGEDVAAFSDALLENAKTYTGKMREKLNKSILERIKK